MIETDRLERLHQGLLDGRRDALAELFDRCRDRLWRIAYFRLDARLKSRVDPDDILQDAYLDAANRLSHYNTEKPFSPFVWLRMIVGQTLLDVHRRHLGTQRRDARRETKAPANGFPNATVFSLTACLLGELTSPSQSAMRAERAERLRGVIESMSEADQETLALRHFEELANSEIAEVLEISPKAASIRYVRAIERLKNLLSEVPELANAFRAGR